MQGFKKSTIVVPLCLVLVSIAAFCANVAYAQVINQIDITGSAPTLTLPSKNAGFVTAFTGSCSGLSTDPTFLPVLRYEYSWGGISSIRNIYPRGFVAGSGSAVFEAEGLEPFDVNSSATISSLFAPSTGSSCRFGAIMAGGTVPQVTGAFLTKWFGMVTPSPDYTLMKYSSTGASPALKYTTPATIYSKPVKFYVGCSFASTVTSTLPDLSLHETVNGRSTTSKYPPKFASPYYAGYEGVIDGLTPDLSIKITLAADGQFPKTGSCSNTIIAVESGLNLLQQLYLQSHLGPLGKVMPTTFQYSFSGSTQSGVFTVPQNALILSWHFNCKYKLPPTGAPSFLELGTMFSSKTTYWYLHGKSDPMSLYQYWDSMNAIPLDSNSVVNYGPFEGKIGPASCYNTVTGVMGTASQINTYYLHSIGIRNSF
jgi:hypothetical protein